MGYVEQRIRTYDDGSIGYFNEKGELHRLDGPASIWADGTEVWCVKDKRHRLDGPACEWADGSKAFFIEDKLHNPHGPAIIWANGNKEYWLNGGVMTHDEWRGKRKEFTP